MITWRADNPAAPPPMMQMSMVSPLAASNERLRPSSGVVCMEKEPGRPGMFVDGWRQLSHEILARMQTYSIRFDAIRVVLTKREMEEMDRKGMALRITVVVQLTADHHAYSLSRRHNQPRVAFLPHSTSRPPAGAPAIMMHPCHSTHGNTETLNRPSWNLSRPYGRRSTSSTSSRAIHC